MEMGFAWRSKLPGLTSSTSVGGWQWRALNGALYYDFSNASDFGFSHQKSAITRSRFNLLPNTVTLWRDPTSYYRYQHFKDLALTGEFFALDRQSYYSGTMTAQHLAGAYTSWAGKPQAFPSAVGFWSTSDDARALKAQAIVKALKDLGSKKASMGENLAQLGKSVSTLQSLGSDVVQLLKVALALKKGKIPNLMQLNVKSLKKLVKSGKVEKRAANYWLSYYYGIKPVVSDIQGILDLIDESKSKAFLVHGRGRARQNFDAKGKSPPAGFTPGVLMDFHGELRAECGVTGQIESQTLRNFNRLGLLNPIQLGWELVPFSFVIDWFVPVSDFLEAMGATVGVKFVGGTSSVSFNQTLIGNIDPAYQRGDKGMVTVIIGHGFARDRLFDWPHPGTFYTKKFYSGVDRWATIGALATSLLR